MEPEVTIISAFIFGLGSFLAPCSFVMVPVFISYLTSKVADRKSKTSLIWTLLLYLISFLLVFGIIGFSTTSLGLFFIQNKVRFVQVMAILMILFGIILLFGHKIKPLSFMFVERKIHIDPKNYKGNFFFPVVLGLTSGFAWSSCQGPIFGAILGMTAAVAETGLQGAFYLIIYGLGINVPMIVIALTLDKSRLLISKINKYSKFVFYFSGILMILLGVFLFFNPNV